MLGDAEATRTTWGSDAHDAGGDGDDYTFRARGRGRSESFVNELEDEEVRLKERDLQRKVEAGVKRHGDMASFDSVENFEPMVRTQLSQRALEIVTKLDHTQFNKSAMPNNSVELFPQPVVDISREEEEDAFALEEEAIAAQLLSPPPERNVTTTSATTSAPEVKRVAVAHIMDHSKTEANRPGQGVVGSTESVLSRKPVTLGSKVLKASMVSKLQILMKRKKSKQNATSREVTDQSHEGPSGGVPISVTTSNLQRDGRPGETLAGPLHDGTATGTDGPASPDLFDYYVKVLLLGDSGVGKTSLMMRFSDNEFNQSLMSTAGVDFKVRFLQDPVKTNGKRIKCQIWDTAGQERFHVITRTYYRGAHGIALVYDVTNEHSFKQISYWMNNIRAHAGPDVFIVLFGNKVDLPNRQVSPEQGLAAAEEFGCLFYETSAKDGTNVLQAFEALSMNAAARIDANTKRETPPAQRGGIDIDTRRRQACVIL
mmetsp:Transcript_4563/g.8037  ORF Transcript_4563/g.8037 Transcript_4563/m.8037 type:complete len:485 (+) Transcript_4563:284-1738(+)